MILKSRILHYLDEHYGIILKRLVRESFLGKTYNVIQGSLRETADYDDAWLLALGLHAQNIFDIGSNIGQASLLMSYGDRLEQIILVDPNPAALAMAAENLILNDISPKARFVCAFVSDQPDQQATLYTVGVGAAGSMYASHARTASSMGVSITARTTTIDCLAEQFGVVPDLVKIDVEGAEGLVLQGAVQLATHQQSQFLVEMHSSSELTMTDNAQKVLDWCALCHYQAWYLKEKVQLTQPQQIATRGRCHLLLLPEKMAFPEYLFPLEQGAPLKKALV